MLEIGFNARHSAAIALWVNILREYFGEYRIQIVIDDGNHPVYQPIWNGNRRQNSILSSSMEHHRHLFNLGLLQSLRVYTAPIIDPMRLSCVYHASSLFLVYMTETSDGLVQLSSMSKKCLLISHCYVSLTITQYETILDHPLLIIVVETAPWAYIHQIGKRILLVLSHNLCA